MDETLLPIIEDQVAVFENQYNAKVKLIPQSEKEAVLSLTKNKSGIVVLSRKLNKEEMTKGKYNSNKIMGYSLRTDKYRYTVWMNDFTTNQPFEKNKVFADELYDYVNDPLEKNNVVDDKNYTNISKEMKSNMLQFFAGQLHK